MFGKRLLVVTVDFFDKKIREQGLDSDCVSMMEKDFVAVLKYLFNHIA